MPTKQKLKRPKKKDNKKHSARRGKQNEKLQMDTESTENSAIEITTPVENPIVPTLVKNVDSKETIDASVINPSAQALGRNQNYSFIKTASIIPTLKKNADVTHKDIDTIVKGLPALTLDNADFSSTFINEKTDSIAKSPLIKTPSVPTLDEENATCIGFAESMEVPCRSTLCKNVDSVPIKIARAQTPAPQNPKKRSTLKRISLNNDKFMENFNPETSSREYRKINTRIRNLNTNRLHPGALYDKHGIHIASGKDICDCLFPNCSGCFYECPKCNSTKCGMKCRVYRTFVYDQVNFEGTDLSFKFEDRVKDCL